MTSLDVYALAGVASVVLGLLAVVTRAHLLWKILGINVMGTGVFLILVASSPRLVADSADPVPQAMVLTGIVVALASTALALGLTLRVAARTGEPYLTEDLTDRHGEGEDG